MSVKKRKIWMTNDLIKNFDQKQYSGLVSYLRLSYSKKSSGMSIDDYDIINNTKIQLLQIESNYCSRMHKNTLLVTRLLSTVN